jgi:integrase
MPRDANLTRRGAIYYARIFVPKDLQAAMGKSELRPSLRTADYAEAKRRKAAVVDQWHADFDDMRRQAELTDADIAAAVWEHYQAGLAAGEQERASRPTQADVDAAIDRAAASLGPDADALASINAMIEPSSLAHGAEWAARRRRSRLNRLRADLGSGDTRLIEPAADAFLARRRFRIERGGPRYRELCMKLMRAEIEQLERYAERDRGDYTREPADPVVVPPSAPELPPGGDSIMALFGKYETENPNGIRPETLKQNRRDVQHFADFVGPAVRAGKIEKRHVRDWKELLAAYPVKASETKAFAGLSLAETVAANKALPSPKPTLTRPTIRRYLSSLGGFCRWLVANDYLDVNPVADLLPKKTGPVNKRSTFADDQLVTLIRAPLFQQARGNDWRDLDHAGKVAVRDHRYWIPLVMLYSGARPAEIAQLHVDDVRQQHGIWTMHITTEGEGGKRTNNRGSMRVVPIHSALIALGFVKHVQAMARRGERQVFPEIDIPETGQIAAQFSREFNRYLTRLKIKTGPELVTYSLRHTFTDRARRAGFLDEEIGTVIGHDKPTMTGQYGVEQQGTLLRRQEIVEAVSYPL